VMEGELLGTKTGLGDSVDANDVAFESSFPYVALPHSGSAGKSAPVTKLASKSSGVSVGAAVGIGIGALVLGSVLVGLLSSRSRAGSAH